jgi:hemoglobin-like flavoprotein
MLLQRRQQQQQQQQQQAAAAAAAAASKQQQQSRLQPLHLPVRAAHVVLLLLPRARAVFHAVENVSSQTFCAELLFWEA